MPKDDGLGPLVTFTTCILLLIGFTMGVWLQNGIDHPVPVLVVKGAVDTIPSGP